MPTWDGHDDNVGWDSGRFVLIHVKVKETTGFFSGTIVKRGNKMTRLESSLSC
jgi:hypothetical protein